MNLVDLRSDTVTLPTRAMYDAMTTASLGDDSLDGDPTVRLLEDEAAALLGKPASLYVPTATMANLLAVMTQSSRGRIVPMEATSHLFRVQGSAAVLTGSTFEGVHGHSGAIDLDVLEAKLQRGYSTTHPTMVCLESSHNHAGGAILPMDHLREVDRLAKRFGCAVHLDGARLFNAAVASGIAPRALTDLVTTVSVCLSKGLSAPMGAILAGPVAVISAARDLRKLLGGSQRQAGIAAAAGRIAIHCMVERLAEDHRHAWRLSRRLDDIGGELGFSVNRPQTNILLVDVSRTGHCASAWVERLSERGVRVRAWNPGLLRCVTHRHIDSAGIEAAADAFRLSGEAMRAERA